VSPGRRAVVVGLSVLLVALSALVYSRYFSGRNWLLPLLGAAAIPALLILVGFRLRWTRNRMAVLGTVLLIVFEVYTLYTRSTYFGVPAALTGRDLSSGLAHGWGSLLTTDLPSRVTAPLLAPLETITWVASMMGATLAVRARGPLAPLLPPFLALAGALALTASEPGVAVGITAAFALVAVAQGLLRANAASGAGQTIVVRGTDPVARRWDWMSRGAAGLAMAIVVFVAGLGGSAAFSRADPALRFDPRSLIHQQPLVVSGISPLATVDAQLHARPTRLLFSVRFGTGSSGRAPTDRLRLVGLDSYDGTIWTTTDLFEPVGSAVPQPVSSNPQGFVDVEEKVEVSGLPGPFLPAAGRPVHTTLGHAAFDPQSGDLMASGPGVLPTSYVELSSFSEPSDSQLGRAVPYTGRGGQELTAIPAGLPPRIANLARQITAGDDSPITELRAIESYLRTGYAFNPSAPPGSSLASVDRFLFTTKSGQPEQFAAAFAILARVLGLPARVSVGYLLDRRSDSGGLFNVTTADGFTWPEVNFQRYGWVAFNPMDPGRLVDSPSPLARANPSEGTEAQPTLAGGSRPATKRVEHPAVHQARSSSRFAHHTLILGVAAALGLMVLVLGLASTLVVAAKAIRRRHRANSHSATGRVFGAWSEVCDRLTEQGAFLADTLTASEVASRATRYVGAAASAAIADIAPIVGETIYAPYEPDFRSADSAWVLEARVRGLIRRDATLAARWRARVDPRPLRSGFGGWVGWLWVVWLGLVRG
jgi:hypothetical protein